ncbi:Non-heme chloroperoxidase [bacterium YEK0313]|nr:Non-heme chloroperoxidase [bacterium YEK0313]
MPSFTLADGRVVTYGETGRGPHLVLVHGSPGEGRAWNRVVPLLADRFHVLTPDLPGYGRASPLAGTAGTAAMAEGIVQLVESLDGPVLLGGHSYGGNVALHVMARAPARVRALALFEPVFFRALELSGDTAALDEAGRYFSAYAARAAIGERDAIIDMVDYWFGQGAFGHLPPPVQDFLRGAAERNAVDVNASFAESLPKPALTGFDRPAVVAHGSASAPVAIAIARALGALLPAADVVSIAGASHGMIDTHPGETACLIAGLAA